MIAKELQNSADAMARLPALSPVVTAVAEAIADSLRQGGKVLVFGNGGSAADAQHFAAELVGRFRHERWPWPALALTTDTSVLTAIGNDYGYEHVFSRQVWALATSRDVIIGISTSGRSRNVRRAMDIAGGKCARTVLLTGAHPVGAAAEFVVAVPSDVTSIVQECHTAILHAICAYLETELVPR